TFEEFLVRGDEDTWAEWVDGEVVLLTPAATKHQRIARFLGDFLGNFVLLRQLGEVFQAPFTIKLPPPLKRGREPDVIFISRERLHQLKPAYFDGAPDLVVEITSPESIARDRGEKYVEYEAAGIDEYWLIDPDRQQAEFYRLGTDGRYRLHIADAEGVYRSEVIPGLWLKVAWLWQDPPPAGVKALREIGVI
ncbi:MAG: Uma2 family endonuclease, partial [Moorella sp. (in: Bacteria)]|nr:Uma2 family endonuclease [Moorella sp. (in: firmicutes)]